MKMRSLLPIAPIAVIALLGACHAVEIDARAEAKVADARNSAEHRIVYATCTDHARFGPDCGLISRIAASDDFRARFRDKICPNKEPDVCQTAYDRLIDAEMARRYNAADWQAVASDCARRPGVCDDDVAYEKLLMNSHNARVQANYGEEERRIDDERALEHRADEAAALHTVGAVIDTVAVLNGGTVCHSYPSVFGGENTVCSQ